MSHFRERSNLAFPTHSRTPYSRPNTHGFFKTPNRSSALNPNFGKSFAPAKPHGLRSSNPIQYEHTQNHPPFAFYDDDSPSVNENYGPSTSRYTETFKNRPGEFRPRKSQLECKSPVPFQELETMSIRSNADVTDVPRKTKFAKTMQEISTSDSFQIKVRENSLRIFSGSIANLFQWSKLKEKFYILFEVRAVLENMQPGKWSSEKILQLTDSKAGPRMQVLYYEIDRPLPPLSIHSVIRCIGRLLARNRLQAFKVEEISEEERNDSQRLSFICNRVAEELMALKQKKLQ